MGGVGAGIDGEPGELTCNPGVRGRGLELGLGYGSSMDAPSENFHELLTELQELGAPNWYLDAVTRPKRSRFVPASDGTLLHLVHWNEDDRDKPVLLLLHGFLANTHAWDAVAPFFTSTHRVVALDWPGMGRSGHRADYGGPAEVAHDARDAAAALDAGPLDIVAHSFGGATAVHFAGQWPGHVRRLLVLDSAILVPGLDELRRGFGIGPPRLYPDRASILARYRLLPDQPCPAWALRWMAHHSARPVEGGWAWRFDPRLPRRTLGFDTWQAWQALRVPVHFISCSLGSNHSEPRLQALSAARGRKVPWPVLEAHHHAMLDAPLALRDRLQALLAEDPSVW